MSLAIPIKTNWLYDFGEYTATALGAQAAVAIDTKIASQRQQAIDLINSGTFGPVGGTYRVTARADSNSPQGFTVEIRQVTV